ncbi:phosphatase PAP2 family protein [Hymenobacter sp. UV11]|uniref:phosphatase PAP2 family protein n=1 Tax=Hymenobacter sp. UV11 TaxID=1849735 RepID=UPI001414E48B|nr:phosphatase PAP2 family protein [Hymenobacter sp. UV11]
MALYSLPTSWFAGLLLTCCLGTAQAQQLPPPPPVPAADTLHKYERPATGPAAVEHKGFFQSKGFRATIVPAVLIGYGISTINGNGFYSSYSAQHDVRDLFGSYRSTVDNYLQFAPYAMLGGVLALGVESRNDRVNLLLVIAKSEAIMLSSVFVVKATTGILRPDGSDKLSFPSGHAAQAFLAASIVHTELRDKSQWYGVGAYTIATSVAAYRMINNKHWQSDVVAGAGFGILSAHLAYLTHRYRWGQKPKDTATLRVTPLYYAGAAGLTLNWQLH